MPAVSGEVADLINFVIKLNHDFTTGVVKSAQMSIPETDSEETNQRPISRWLFVLTRGINYGQKITTLYISDTNIRLMVRRGKRISKLADAPLDMNLADISAEVKEAELIAKIRAAL